MIFAITQLAVSVLLFLAVVTEFVCWLWQGKVAGLGYLACAAAVCVFWWLVKLSYREYKETKENQL